MIKRSESAAALSAFSTSLLMASGADAPSARAATDALMHASLHGVDSHGVRLLPWYCDCLRSGVAIGAPEISITRPRPATAIVDAGGGLGHLPTYKAMEEACALARTHGIGMGLVLHSTHFGAAGAYALCAAQTGYIGFVTCNSTALVTPFGGTERLHGTNPIAFAAPNPGGDPFLLDMATSAIPWNKVLRSRTEGLDLPHGTAVSRHGHDVTDPHMAEALAPLGGPDFGYKGAGLAGLADILGGILTGMRLSTEQPPHLQGDTMLGHFVMAIDPQLLMPLGVFASRLQSYLDNFHAQPGTYAAGGPEWLRKKEREQTGVPLPDGLNGELQAAAKSAGITYPFDETAGGAA